MTVFKLLKNDRGILYEIPLILMGYGVMCAVSYPVLRRLLPVNPLISIIPLLLLGLGVVLYLGKSITIPRVRFLGAPAGLWIFALLSTVTLPYMWFNSETISITAALLAQTYGSFRFDLWLAEKKTKTQGKI